MEKPDFQNYLEVKHLTSKKENVNQHLTSWEIKELVETVPFVAEQWLPYHCKAVKRIGASKYLALADMARKGKHPASLFSFLLKQEMAR